MSADLLEDDQHVSDIGLTVTVSFKDDNDIVDSQDPDTSETRQIFTQDGQEASKCDQDLIEDVENSTEDEDEAGATQEEDDDESVSEESHSPEASSPPKILRREKPKEKKYGKYTSEALAAAWSAINNDSLSVHMASLIYKIPKSTLYDRVNNRNVFHLGGKPNAQKKKFIDPDTERQMVEHIRLLKSTGYNISKNEILSLATKLSNATGHLVKNKKLTRGWLGSFMERWPNLRSQSQQTEGMERPPNVTAYYDRLKFLMNTRNQSFHKKPHLIFNMDEIAVTTDKHPNQDQLVPRVKSRADVKPNDNVLFSVIICGSALGHVLSPFFIFRNTKPKGKINDDIFLTTSATGLMDGSVFATFLEDHFTEHICLGLPDRVLLLHEQCAEYMDEKCTEWARERRVILFPYPPHVYFSSQPLKFGCVDAINITFNKAWSQQNSQKDIKFLFQLMLTILEKSVSVQALRDMFERAGIFPYDTSKLTKEHLLPCTYQSESRDSELGKRSLVKRKKRKMYEEVQDHCCVCLKSEPPSSSGFCLEESLLFWGQCSRCDHWVHLKYCSPKIRKITVGRYNKYSPEDLRSAYEAIKFQCLSVNAASVQFGIPKSTLYDRLNERSSYNLRGRPNRLKSKILDERTEQQMVEHIQHMESVGQRLNQSGILALATKLAHSSGTIAEGRSISRSWYKAFLGRWPNVKDVPDPTPKPEIPNYKQPKSREEFCLVIKSVIDKLKLHTKPHLIYKVDEILINFDKKSSSCIPCAESRSQSLDATKVVSSVLLCANSIGLSLPPYFITKKKKKLNFLSGGMDGSSVKASETGLVSTSVLKGFLKEHFLPHAGKKNEDQVLLLYGDQANIVTPAMAEMARGLGIALYTLPEFTHSCKLDYFYPIGHALSKTCADFLEGRQSITSSDLPHLLYLAIVKAMTVKNIKSSFLRAGIYPVDEAIKGMKNSKNCPDAEPGKGCRETKSSCGRKKCRLT